MIVTTRDKITLCLMKHLQRSGSTTGWIAPLSVLLSLIAAMVAADFRDSLGMSAKNWSDAFKIGSGIVVFWLVIEVVKSIRSFRALRQGDPIELIVQTLKADQIETADDPAE